MHHFSPSLAAKLLLTSLILLGGSDRCDAANVTDISADGCVAKSGFEQCIATTVSDETDCMNEAVTSTDTTACGLLSQVNKLNCYMSSCWNKVYSCEYQYLAGEFTDARALTVPEAIPFWPAPDNAPGGCSCNLGKLYINATQSLYQTFNCPLDKSSACGCCAFSGALSAYHAICPDNDGNLLGYSGTLDSFHDLEDTIGTGICTRYLDTCVTDLGFEPAAGGEFLDPDNLPSLGDKPYSTTAGTLTTLPGGPTVTWSILGSVWTVTAQSYSGSSSPTITGGTAGSTATGAAGGATGGATGDTAGGATEPSLGNSLMERIPVGMWVPVLVCTLWMGW